MMWPPMGAPLGVLRTMGMGTPPLVASGTFVVAMETLLVIGVFFGVLFALFWFLSVKDPMKTAAAFATERGWTYSPEADWEFPLAHPDLELLQRGTNRHARHIFRGTVGDIRFQLCEYHYEITEIRSFDSKVTTVFWHTLGFFHPPHPLEPLHIRRETARDKVSAMFGGGDINFESAEFSERFHVSAPNRDWAYAVVQPKSMEWMLRHPDRVVCMDTKGLMLVDQGKIKLDTLPGLVHMGTSLLLNLPPFVKG